jgi:poly(A) polymerase
MTVPVIVCRAEHAVSRRQIDPDALKVLYRLHQNNYVAYLVGGSVRDLLLGRRPEGLRHRHLGASVSGQAAVPELLDHRAAVPPRARALRHKAIEVATFRRQSPPRSCGTEELRTIGIPLPTRQDADRLLHRDNTFGTPEEDAFRRDFTINALFYDIADFSIIDYTGGLRDLEARVIRCIGDPTERFRRIRFG